MFSQNRLKHHVLDLIRHIKNLYTNDRVRFNVDRFKISQNKKSNIVIKQEMNELKAYWGDIPMQYITHDFYDKNCKLSLDEMKDYIPGYFFYHIIYPMYDDVKKVRLLIENKTNAYFLFKNLGYPLVNPIIFTENGCYDPIKTKYLNDDDFSAWLQQAKSPKVFIKPVEGRGGKGIFVGHKIDGRYLVDNTPVDLTFLKSLNGHYIVEPGIIQSSYVSAVYPNSVNTLRVITKRDLSSQTVAIIAITLRMGCSGREVDNSSQGGLLMGLDIETGSPIYGYAVYEYGAERFYNHPDTDYKFSDFYVRGWHKFKEEVLQLAESMKEINLAGWDIAITDAGPIVIETNVQFGLDHTQSGVGGLRKFFIDGSPLDFVYKTTQK